MNVIKINSMGNYLLEILESITEIISIEGKLILSESFLTTKKMK